jgi:uridine phosphorylase
VPIVLRPTAPVAPDALLPGDPGRALALAQALLAEPRMSNHAHGLWGYSGATADGRELTIQATGVGAPSAALVLRDLAELGVRRAIRVGTCMGLADGVGLAEMLVCERALAGDGTSRALGVDGIATPDEELTGRLRDAAGAEARSGAVASTDLIWALEPGGPATSPRRDWLERNALGVEMQTAALFALGARLGVATACVLVVAGLAGDGADEASEAALEDAALAAATIAARALAV